MGADEKNGEKLKIHLEHRVTSYDGNKLARRGRNGPKRHTRRTHMYQQATVATCAFSIGMNSPDEHPELFD